MHRDERSSRAQVASPLFARLEGWQGRRLVYRHGHTVQRVHEDSLETSPLPGSNRGSLHTDDSDVTINAARFAGV